jgi:hypothetical protein
MAVGRGLFHAGLYIRIEKGGKGEKGKEGKR